MVWSSVGAAVRYPLSVVYCCIVALKLPILQHEYAVHAAHTAHTAHTTRIETDCSDRMHAAPR